MVADRFADYAVRIPDQPHLAKLTFAEPTSTFEFMTSSVQPQQKSPTFSMQTSGMLSIFPMLLALCTLGCGDKTNTTNETKSETENNTVQETNVVGAAGDFSELILESNKTPRALNDSDWFENVTQSSGVDFTYHSGRNAGHFTMVEGIGGGVALFDYDRDGDLDLFCAAGGKISDDLKITGRPCRLYRNDGDFQFTDVTKETGLDVEIDYSHGVAVGDINNDGFPDLFVTCFGKSRMFLNDNGTSFKDVTDELGIEVTGWNSAVCLADFNGDSHADVFVTGYLNWTPDPDARCVDPISGLRDVCVPSSFEGLRDFLLLNRGNGKFEDASEIYGLIQNGKGLGIVAADFDDNGRLDVYVANDVQRNFFYCGQEDSTWTERAVSAGVAGNEFGVAEGSMGVDAADINGDNLPDIVVTNFEIEDNDLYKNEGSGVFTHSTSAVGLAGTCKPYVGFGVAFADFDMDGRQDIVVTNGHLVYRHRQYDYQQPAFLYRNNGGRFENITERAGPWFSVPHSGRGLAVGDINNDGAEDIVISEQDGPISILKNRNQPANWIGFVLVGTKSGVDAIGTKVSLNVDGNKVVQQKIAGGGYLSYSDPRLLFALPDADTSDRSRR